MPDKLTLIHFSDTCSISDPDLISRFTHLCHSAKAANPTKTLTVFGGNAFSPGLGSDSVVHCFESNLMRGDHIVPILNHLGIDVALYGPHDFDFGEDRLDKLSQKTNFPWLLSNIRGQGWDKGNVLAAARDFVVKSVGEYQIGFIGLAGPDWHSECPNSPPIDVWPPIPVCKPLLSHLRTVKPCDFVIAITNMPLVQDLALSEATLHGEERIDLILGGHDHQFLCRSAGDANTNPKIILENQDVGSTLSQGRVIYVEGGVRIIKSGTDWQGCSLVDLIVAKDREGNARLETVIVNHHPNLRRHAAYENLPADLFIPEIISQIRKDVEYEIERTILLSLASIDARAHLTRPQETALGSLLADAVRAFFDADIAIVESGGIGCGLVFEVDPIIGLRMSVRDMVGLFPYDNAFFVSLVQGKTLLAALENSLSDKHADGRFLQVSGLRLVANWTKPEGQRVLKKCTISEGGFEEEIDDEKWYRVAMPSLMILEHIGYFFLKDGITQTGSEMTVMKIRLLLEIFRAPMENRPRTRFAQGIKRARRAVIVGFLSELQIPVIRPKIDGRITFVDMQMEKADDGNELEQTLTG